MSLDKPQLKLLYSCKYEVNMKNQISKVKFVVFLKDFFSLGIISHCSILELLFKQNTEITVKLLCHIDFLYKNLTKIFMFCHLMFCEMKQILLCSFHTQHDILSGFLTGEFLLALTRS